MCDNAYWPWAADRAKLRSTEGVRAVSIEPPDAEAFLATVAEPQLVRFLVRYAYQLTMHGRATYVPGGDDLQDPRLLRLINETIHRALDHADACLAGRMARRPIQALCNVLFGHDSPTMKQVTESAFRDACKSISETT